jgi:hypothetical protein
LFIVPGIALMVLGFLIMAPLLAGPVKISGLVFDYHSALFGSMFVILGYQTIITGLFAKAYALTQSFRIPDGFMKKFYSVFTLEYGILSGLAVLLIGMGIEIAVIFSWAESGYSNLSMASLVAFGSTLIIIGLQTVFASFFLSLLKR